MVWAGLSADGGSVHVIKVPLGIFAWQKRLITDARTGLLPPSRPGLGEPWGHPLLQASIHCDKHQTGMWFTIHAAGPAHAAVLLGKQHADST